MSRVGQRIHVANSLALAILITAPLYFTVALEPCPVRTNNFRSDDANGESNLIPVSFENALPEDIELKWVGFDGQEGLDKILHPGQVLTHETRPGHAFRAYTRSGQQLILEHVVSKREKYVVQIVTCAQHTTDSLSACPAKTPSLKSVSKSSAKVSVSYQNLLPTDVSLKWINFQGDEAELSILGPSDDFPQDTWPGHAFRAYTADGHHLLLEHIVTEAGRVPVGGCLINGTYGVTTKLADSRNEEFEALQHDHAAPCLPAETSSKWSCVRHIPIEEYAKRTTARFGFADANEAGIRQAGDEFDASYTGHIPKMPRLTVGPGFLKMNFTKRMLDKVIPWYHQRKQDYMQQHPDIPGGYTNTHVHHFDLLEVGKFPAIQKEIVREMRAVLEWWTGLQLKHTSTFGVRIYRRHAMLINHVDRGDTHIASAVLQVHQVCDEDGGWPLEVHSEDGKAYEVYLQPGEMVLYEGGRLRHGRPMRLRGVEFANVFSHFAPLDWYGPGKSPDFKPAVLQPPTSPKEMPKEVQRASEHVDEFGTQAGTNMEL